MVPNIAPREESLRERERDMRETGQWKERLRGQRVECTSRSQAKISGWVLAGSEGGSQA